MFGLDGCLLFIRNLMIMWLFKFLLLLFCFVFVILYDVLSVIFVIFNVFLFLSLKFFLIKLFGFKFFILMIIFGLIERFSVLVWNELFDVFELLK